MCLVARSRNSKPDQGNVKMRFLMIVILAFFPNLSMSQNINQDDIDILSEKYTSEGMATFTTSCRSAEGAVKQIHSHDFSVERPTGTTKYNLHYRAETTITLCEWKECGCCGCWRVCDVNYGDLTLARELSIIEPERKVIATRDWVLGRAGSYRVSDNCNAVSGSVGSIANGRLGTYDNYSNIIIGDVRKTETEYK